MQNQTPREQEMRAIVRECDTGNETWEEVADREGVAASTLRWWRSEIRRRDRDRHAGGNDFVEVDISAITERTPSTLELILLDGRSVRIPSGFDADDLRRLLEVLDAPC